MSHCPTMASNNRTRKASAKRDQAPNFPGKNGNVVSCLFLFPSFEVQLYLLFTTRVRIILFPLIFHIKDTWQNNTVLHFGKSVKTKLAELAWCISVETKLPELEWCITRKIEIH